jgi:hypothetical protein
MATAEQKVKTSGLVGTAEAGRHQKDSEHCDGGCPTDDRHGDQILQLQLIVRSGSHSYSEDTDNPSTGNHQSNSARVARISVAVDHHLSFDQISTRRRRSALLTTDTELKLMAAAAIIGESSRPKNG